MKIAEMLDREELVIFLENEIEKEVYRQRFAEKSEGVKYPDVSSVLALTRSFILGDYMPELPDRLRITKLGSDKKRIIYVYPLFDRLVLKAVHYCLARTDLGLSPNCLAFRPGFSIHGAFRSVIRRYRPDYACVRIDIRNYFNSIPITNIIGVLEAVLCGDRELVTAVSRLLRRPEVLENNRVVADEEKGVMAGMPLSPLLANLYLTEFDKKAESWAPVYARYSDDIIFFCPPERTEELWERIRTEFSGYGLTINDEKSSIALPGQAWEFLGLSYRDGRIGLSAASIRKMKGKISRAARKLYRWKVRKAASTERAARALIRKFQYKFYGSGLKDDELTWSRWYFPLISDADDLREIDAYMQEMLRYLETGRHTKNNYKQFPYERFRRLGYIPLTSAFYGVQKVTEEEEGSRRRRTHRRAPNCFSGENTKE
jgi:hypothetical protein